MVAAGAFASAAAVNFPHLAALASCRTLATSRVRTSRHVRNWGQRMATKHRMFSPNSHERPANWSPYLSIARHNAPIPSHTLTTNHLVVAHGAVGAAAASRGTRTARRTRGVEKPRCRAFCFRACLRRGSLRSH